MRLRFLFCDRADRLAVAAVVPADPVVEATVEEEAVGVVGVVLVGRGTPVIAV